MSLNELNYNYYSIVGYLSHSIKNINPVSSSIHIMVYISFDTIYVHGLHDIHDESIFDDSTDDNIDDSAFDNKEHDEAIVKLLDSAGYLNKYKIVNDTPIESETINLGKSSIIEYNRKDNKCTITDMTETLPLL